MAENVDKEMAKSVFTEWIGKISSEGHVGEIDPTIVKTVLVDMGAKAEIPEEAKHFLGCYPNVLKRQGLDAVWGDSAVSKFKDWVVGDFIPAAEKKFNKKFPTLYNPKTKLYDVVNTSYSGSMQFLGELTAFAFGSESLNDFKRRTERRAEKGIRWSDGAYEPSTNHPFPPGFPEAAIGKIAEIKQKEVVSSI